jgi:hypothetical protein
MTKLVRVGFIVAAVLGMLTTQCGDSDSPEGQTEFQDDVPDEVLPEFEGGTYQTGVSSLTQEPIGCLIPNWALVLITPIISGISFDVELPSGVEILDSGNAYPLTLNLPDPLAPAEVILSLDTTYDNILMDGPDSYTVDLTGLVPQFDCVITGSADGIFDDINAQELTGSLTIRITDVQPSPGGSCALNTPGGDCDLTVNIDAGVPVL